MLILVAFSLFCWDLATVDLATVAQGTFRYLKDFNSGTCDTTIVAIVPSDYEGLDVIKSRTSDLSYTEVENMVRKAVELQGGFDSVIKKGNKVMIKVNLVGGNSPSGQGENTDVRVPKALVKIIHEATGGDVELIIAEGSARSNDNPDEAGSVWENSGYTDLLTDPYLNGINLRLLNLNQAISDLEEVNLGDQGTAAPHDYKFHVHHEELKADVYISVPVLKIHNPGITCVLKNQIGTAPGSYYGYNKSNGREKDGSNTPSKIHPVIANQDWSEEEIVDLSNIAGIDYIVVDALMCLERSKSYNGNNQVRMNTIVAGADPVAVDHVCAKLFCLNPDDITHITLSEKVGLGTNNPELIKIKGASIENVRKKVKKTGSIQGQFGQSNRIWILSKKYDGTVMNTEYIPNEADLEPVAGENNWSEPVYFFDNMLDLLSFYDGATNMVSYAFTYFYSPEDKKAELKIGSHEDMIVYLNGVAVYSYSGLRGSTSELDDSKEINIIKGENRLLVKTLNRTGIYTFSLNICDYESAEQYGNNRVKGLFFYTAKEEPSGIEDRHSMSEKLLRNYPNPVTNSTQIEFELPYAADISVDVYDLEGRLVSHLAGGFYSAGYHKMEWTATNMTGNRVSTGIYLCSIKSKDFNNSIRIFVK